MTAIEMCECQRGTFNADEFGSCYECFLERRSDFQTCIFCGSWHSPRFPTCFRCRRIPGRDEAAVALRYDVQARDGWQCRECGDVSGLQVDHIKPCASGGRADPWNLQVLCQSCNHQKSDTWWEGCRWSRTRDRLMEVYFIAGFRLLDDDQRTRLSKEVRRLGLDRPRSDRPPTVSTSTCTACSLPMVADLLGDGRHPTCSEPSTNEEINAA